jgi:hypothetical protein
MKEKTQMKSEIKKEILKITMMFHRKYGNTLIICIQIHHKMYKFLQVY